LWTYDPTQIAAKPLFQVRWLIGDVIQTDQQLQDEEIGFAVTQRPSIYGAAAECCRALSARLARQADTAQGDLHTTYSQRSRAYALRAAEYESKAAIRGGALPYAGGVGIADKQNQEADTDRVPPQFQIGMEDSSLPVSSAGNQSIEPPEPGVSS